MLDPQNQFIANISSGLFKHMGTSYEQALAFFNEVRSNLTSIRQDGGAFLDGVLKGVGNSTLGALVSEVMALIPPETYELYKKEMDKAKDILSFIDYVQQQGQSYRSSLLGIMSAYQKNMLGFAKGLID